MKKLLALACASLCLSAAAQTVIVKASYISDSAGRYANGTIYFQPASTNGQPTSYRKGGGGVVTVLPVSAPISAGAFSITLPDTAVTTPAHVCFTARAVQAGTGYPLLGPGYSCLQPHYTASGSNDWCQAGVCNLDDYVPNIPALAQTALLPGATLPASGMVVALSPTTSRAATATDIVPLISSGTVSTTTNCVAWDGTGKLTLAAAPCGGSAGVPATVKSGENPVIAGDGLLTGGISAFGKDVATQTGNITNFQVWAQGTDTVTLEVITVNGSTATLTATQTWPVVAGLNSFTGLSIPVTTGQYVGVYDPVLNLKWYTTGGVGNFNFTGLIGGGTIGGTSTIALGSDVVSGMERNYTISYTTAGVDITPLTNRVNALTTPSPVIVALGNSLTSGVGGTSWPTQLAALLPGRTIINAGVASTSMQSIFQRFGSYPILTTLPSNQIPASGPVTFTLPYSLNPCNPNGGCPLHGNIMGIPGTLAYVSASGYATITDTFTRDTPGSAVTIYPNTPFIVDDPGYANKTVIFWAARNSIGLQENTGLSSAQQLANVQDATLKAIAYLNTTNKHFLIFSESNRNDEYPGSTATAAGAALNGDQSYTLINQVNDWYKATAPANYVEVRRAVVNGYNTGSGPDVTAFGRDTPPPSLMSDQIHYNTAGYAIVAREVAAALARLNY